MSKIRINDLARELEVKSKEILDVLTTVGVTEKKTHSSSLEEHEADLVRKHLRGRSERRPVRQSLTRAARGEDEIKTKIDLSHISRPGDVLRAITQQKEPSNIRQPRPAVKPPVARRPVEAKAAAPTAPAKWKAVPSKACDAKPLRRAAGAETGYSGFGSCAHRPPTVVVIPPKRPPFHPRLRLHRLPLQAHDCTACDCRSATSSDSGARRQPGVLRLLHRRRRKIALRKMQAPAPREASTSMHHRRE